MGLSKKVKQLRGFFVSSFVIAMTIAGLGHITRPVQNDICLNAINTFQDMPQNSIEVIGYGSSHMWRGLNVMTMYEEYGIAAYNYGNNWQHFDTTLLFIKDSFRKQTPKVVLVECYKIGEIFEETTMDGEIYYTRALPETREKFNFLSTCFGSNKEAWLSYYMPLCAFHQNIWSVTSDSFKLDSSGADFEKTMGSNHWFDNQDYVKLPDASTLSQEPLKKESVEILDEIVSICEKNGAALILYTHPYAGDYPYNEALENYAKENECVYFNMFELIEEIGLTGWDYSDVGHLNQSGAVKVASYLGRYIYQNYDVTDMRTIENNLWEQALDR